MMAELEDASSPERAIDFTRQRFMRTSDISLAHDLDTVIAQKILRMLPQVVHLNRSEPPSTSQTHIGTL
jgi:hypothetical protein